MWISPLWHGFPCHMFCTWLVYISCHNCSADEDDGRGEVKDVRGSGASAAHPVRNPTPQPTGAGPRLKLFQEHSQKVHDGLLYRTACWDWKCLSVQLIWSLLLTLFYVMCTFCLIFMSKQTYQDSNFPIRKTSLHEVIINVYSK